MNFAEIIKVLHNYLFIILLKALYYRIKTIFIFIIMLFKKEFIIKHSNNDFLWKLIVVRKSIWFDHALFSIK